MLGHGGAGRDKMSSVFRIKHMFEVELRPGTTYGHELLQLLPLHASGELALFRGIESSNNKLASASSLWSTPEA